MVHVGLLETAVVVTTGGWGRGLPDVDGGGVDDQILPRDADYEQIRTVNKVGSPNMKLDCPHLDCPA